MSNVRLSDGYLLDTRDESLLPIKIRKDMEFHSIRNQSMMISSGTIVALVEERKSNCTVMIKYTLGDDKVRAVRNYDL